MLTNLNFDVDEISDNTREKLNRALESISNAIDSGMLDNFSENLINDFKMVHDSSISFRLQAKQLNTGSKTAIKKYEALRDKILNYNEEDISVAKLKDLIFQQPTELEQSDDWKFRAWLAFGYTIGCADNQFKVAAILKVINNELWKFDDTLNISSIADQINWEIKC